MRSILCGVLLVVAGCGGPDGGGVTPPPVGKKPDPFLTVRIRNQLDTTKATGQAQWHMFTMLTGPYNSLNGITGAGNISWQDVRLGHDVRCARIQADSVGQRLLSILAIADTTTTEETPDVPVAAIAKAWYEGNHNLPAGYMAMTFAPQDAWNSQQFAAGHGLVPSDPIMWGFDWTGNGISSFYERSDADPTCASAA